MVKPDECCVGKQGFTYVADASAENIGAQSIRVNVLPMRPGAVAKAHYHTGIEAVVYLLDGECEAYYGDNLEKRVWVRQGEQCLVAADTPHAPCNEIGKPCT